MEVQETFEVMGLKVNTLSHNFYVMQATRVLTFSFLF